MLKEKMILKNLRIVIFKSLRNCIRPNKGNFTLKFNSNKIMMCVGVGGGIIRHDYLTRIF